MIFLSPFKLLGILLLLEGIDGFTNGLIPLNRLFSVTCIFLILIALTLIFFPNGINSKFLLFLGIYFLLAGFSKFLDLYATLKLGIGEFPFNPADGGKLFFGIFILFLA